MKSYWARHSEVSVSANRHPSATHSGRATGTLLRGKRDPRNALGEGDYLQATPIQLITAYSALVNGGHLLAPRAAPLADFQVFAARATGDCSRASLSHHRRHARRGALWHGGQRAFEFTPRSKSLARREPLLRCKAFARKVGSLVLQPPNDEALPAPADIRLAVLVFLKRAHGADAAALSRGIFEEYERLRLAQPDSERAATASKNEDNPRSRESGRLPVSPLHLQGSPLAVSTNGFAFTWCAKT